MGIESYSKAKTHYVREKIKSKQWKDRGLIDICLSFEEIIVKGTRGSGRKPWRTTRIGNNTKRNGSQFSRSQSPGNTRNSSRVKDGN